MASKGVALVVWPWLCARARASSSPEPRRGRVLGMAAVYGLRRRGSTGSCKRTNKENGVPRARYRRLNGGRSAPEQGFGQKGRTVLTRRVWGR